MNFRNPQFYPYFYFSFYTKISYTKIKNLKKEKVQEEQWDNCSENPRMRKIMLNRTIQLNYHKSQSHKNKQKYIEIIMLFLKDSKCQKTL